MGATRFSRYVSATLPYPPVPSPQSFLRQGGGGSRTAYSSGRGMDLNPELLSAIDRLCVGLVVQCMFQCRVHNLNLSLWI